MVFAESRAVTSRLGSRWISRRRPPTCSAMPVSSPRRRRQDGVPPRWSAVSREHPASSSRPAVAYLTGALGADFGVMLSASHNPAQDNGIKFFSRGGYKLPDPVEDAIERRLGDLAAAQTPVPGFGRVTDAPQARDRYLEHL